MYEKSLVAGFTGFSLCYLRLSVVHWVFVSFFLFILCLMPLICCAFSFCHWAFLLWVPSDYFLLQYFDLYFFCCVHCGLTFFFYLPGDQPIGRMAFTLFLPVLLFLILCNKAPLSTLLPCLSCTSP